MFLQEEIKPDNRHFLPVFAPGKQFLYKYFDREFDCRITENPADDSDAKFGILVLGVDDSIEPSAQQFLDDCIEHGRFTLILRVPYVLGTGMNDVPMRLARGVARGTQMLIKGNQAQMSVIHATDIALIARLLVSILNQSAEFVISPPPVYVNDLLEALAVRIKDKRIGSISPRWARILYGRELMNILTDSHVVQPSDISGIIPDFNYADPVNYLKTHIYDNESL